MHEYREIPDSTYPHLVNPQCACGNLRYGGFVKSWLARRLYDEHVEATTTPDAEG
jgi:hypothetical protein